MIWLKSILVGLTAAVVSVIAIVIATTMWAVDVNQGSGSVGVVWIGMSALLLFPAALAFALGVRWNFRRQRRRLRGDNSGISA